MINHLVLKRPRFKIAVLFVFGFALVASMLFTNARPAMALNASGTGQTGINGTSTSSASNNSGTGGSIGQATSSGDYVTVPNDKATAKGNSGSDSIQNPNYGYYKGKTVYYQLDIVGDKDLNDSSIWGNFTNHITFHFLSQGVNDGIYYAIFETFCQLPFSLDKLLTYIMLQILNFAYSYDVVNQLIGAIKSSVVNMTGIKSGKFSSKGLFGGFMSLLTAVTVIYTIYLFVVRRATISAFNGILKTVIVLTVSLGFFSNYSTILTGLNTMSTQASAMVLSQNVGVQTDGHGHLQKTTALQKMDDELFDMFVFRPWLQLEFGTSNFQFITSKRAWSLISKDPSSDARHTAIINDVKNHNNQYLTNSTVAYRAGLMLVILILDGFDSLPIYFLSFALVICQFWFLIIAMVAPYALLWSAFPGQFRVMKRYLLELILPLAVKMLISISGLMLFGMIDAVTKVANVNQASMSGIIYTALIETTLLITAFLLRRRIMGIFAAGSGFVNDLRNSASGLAAGAGMLGGAVLGSGFGGYKGYLQGAKKGAKFGQFGVLAGAVTGGFKGAGKGAADGAAKGYNLAGLATGDQTARSAATNVAITDALLKRHRPSLKGNEGNGDKDKKKKDLTNKAKIAGLAAAAVATGGASAAAVGGAEAAGAAGATGAGAAEAGAATSAGVEGASVAETGASAGKFASLNKNVLPDVESEQVLGSKQSGNSNSAMPRLNIDNQATSNEGTMPRVNDPSGQIPVQSEKAKSMPHLTEYSGSQPNSAKKPALQQGTGTNISKPLVGNGADNEPLNGKRLYADGIGNKPMQGMSLGDNDGSSATPMGKVPLDGSRPLYSNGLDNQAMQAKSMEAASLQKPSAQGNPVSSQPMNGSPLKPNSGKGTMLDGSRPFQTNGLGGAPLKGTSLKDNPVQANPMSGDKLRTNPLQGNPTNGTPLDGSRPLYSSSLGGSPLQGSPINSAPSKAAPLTGQPLKSSSLTGNPLNNSPLNGNSIQGTPLNGGKMTQSSPLTGTPVQGTPLRGNSLDNSSPIRSNPVKGQPLQGNPMVGSPFSSNPMQSSSLNGTPLREAAPLSEGSSPIQRSSAYGSPMHGQPLQGGQPMRNTPQNSNPMRHVPMQNAPIQGNPIPTKPIYSPPIPTKPIEGDPWNGGDNDL